MLTIRSLSGAAFCVVLGACHEAGRDRPFSPASGADRTLASVVVHRDGPGDSTALVQVRLMPGSEVGTLGSVTASVAFDTLALRFVGDESPAGSVLRAVRAEHGRVRIAAAAPAGLDTLIAQIRFRVFDAGALKTLGLQVSELHTIEAADARPSLVIAPVSAAP